MKEMLKEGAVPIGKVKVIWKKPGIEDKKSIVILDTGNRWNRDNIMRNQKAGKNFIVKKLIPKRFVGKIFPNSLRLRGNQGNSGVFLNPHCVPPPSTPGMSSQSKTPRTWYMNIYSEVGPQNSLVQF